MASNPLTAPFLKRISLRPEKIEREEFPFNRFPNLLHDDFTLDFERPVTILVGENGSGKSTILQAIAELAGFSVGGGDARFQLHYTADKRRSRLAECLRPSWLPKVQSGFYFRSDTFADVARYIDDEGCPDVHHRVPLWERSHGESFLAVFADRFTTTRRCLYLMDEPENALSPMRQFELLRLMRHWEESGNAQMILATHAPILMRYPSAALLHIDSERIAPIDFDAVEHVKVTRAFLGNPQRYLDALFDDEDEDEDEC